MSYGSRRKVRSSARWMVSSSSTTRIRIRRSRVPFPFEDKFSLVMRPSRCVVFSRDFLPSRALPRGVYGVYGVYGVDGVDDFSRHARRGPVEAEARPLAR